MELHTTPPSPRTPKFNIAPPADAKANELPMPAGMMNSLLQNLPQEKLHFENALTMPVEIWLNIFLFVGTKQGIAPLSQVSSTFKMYADHPMFVDLPYAELDYSSPLFNQIKSFPSPFSSRPYSLTPTRSSGFVATGYVVEEELDAYYVGLKPYEKNVSANNETQVEFIKGFQKECADLVSSGPIDYVTEMKKNIFIGIGNHCALLVFDLEKHECKVLQKEGPVIDELFKLSDSLFAAQSDDLIAIWNVETGKKIKEINAVADEINSIYELPQKNLYLIHAEEGIFCLDIVTEEKSNVIDQIIWHDIETKEEKAMALKTNVFGDFIDIDLLSNNKIVLCWKRHWIVTTIDNLFKGVQLNSQNSQYIACDNRSLASCPQGLPNDYIACVARDIANDGHGGTSLMIYDLNQKKFVVDHKLKDAFPHELLLLADQRILLCTEDEITIIPFAVRRNNVMQQKDPENELGEARPVNSNQAANIFALNNKAI